MEQHGKKLFLVVPILMQRTTTKMQISDDGSCSGYPDLAENAISFDGTDDYIDQIDLSFTFFQCL